MYTPEVEQFIKDLGFEKIENRNIRDSYYKHKTMRELRVDGKSLFITHYATKKRISYTFDPTDKMSISTCYMKCVKEYGEAIGRGNVEQEIIDALNLESIIDERIENALDNYTLTHRSDY